MVPIVVAQLAGSAEYGGGERYLELLFDRLDRARYRPVLISPEPGPFVERIQRKRVSTCIIHLTPLLNPVALIRLARLLTRERVTILQTHGARANAYGQVAGRLAGVPIIVSTIHNSLMDYPINRLKRWTYMTILRRTMRFADWIICVSEELRQHVIGDLRTSPGRTVTIYNGVDLTRFQHSDSPASLRRELRVGSGPLLVVIGRLTDQKGHRYLLEALPSLVRRWPELRCLIVGDGELRKPLSELAVRLGVAASCAFIGARTDIPAILGLANVVLLPSISEGFPFILLEALAMSRPVVASRVNGVPELIDDRKTGRLVPPRDVTALASAVRDLLEDPVQAASLGQEGYRRVQKHFTVDRMAAQTAALYETAIRERGIGTWAIPGVRHESAGNL